MSGATLPQGNFTRQPASYQSARRVEADNVHLTFGAIRLLNYRANDGIEAGDVKFVLARADSKRPQVSLAPPSAWDAVHAGLFSPSRRMAPKR